MPTIIESKIIQNVIESRIVSTSINCTIVQNEINSEQVQNTIESSVVQNVIEVTFPQKQGIPGIPGSDGADGADGYSVLSGSGVPDPGLGVNGDFYIDTSSLEIYGPKAAGAWGSATSIIGPQGATGPTGPLDVTQDTRANIIAAIPPSYIMMWATDTQELGFHDGTDLFMPALSYYKQPNEDEDGSSQFGRPHGYYPDKIDRKKLYNIVIGANQRSEHGAAQIVAGVFAYHNGVSMIPIVAGFTLREDEDGSGLFTHDFGLGEVNIHDGASVRKGLNGVPIIQEYGEQAGSRPAPLYRNGGFY